MYVLCSYQNAKSHEDDVNYLSSYFFYNVLDFIIKHYNDFKNLIQ